MNNAITHESLLLEVRDLTVRYGRDADHAAVAPASQPSFHRVTCVSGSVIALS